MKLGYLSFVLSAVLTLLCGRFYLVSVANAMARSETLEFQHLGDTLEGNLLSKRQLLQAQQEKLNKGSAISATVGPAVLADINAAAEKGSVRLKELLQKYGVVNEVKGAPAQTTDRKVSN